MTDLWWLGCLASAAPILAVGLYSIFFFSDSISPDEAGTLVLATTERPRPRNGVLVPLSVRMLCIAIPTELAARLVILMSAILGIVVTFFIGNLVRDAAVGMIAALFLTLNPWYWMMSNRILLDVPATAACAACVYSLLLFTTTGDARYFALACASLIAAVLTKPASVALLPLVLGGGAYRYWRTGATHNPSARLLISAAATGVIVAVALLVSRRIAHRVANVSNLASSASRQPLGPQLHAFGELLCGYFPRSGMLVDVAIGGTVVTAAIFAAARAPDIVPHAVLVSWVVCILGFRMLWHPAGRPVTRHLLPLLPAIVISVAAAFCEARELALSLWVRLFLDGLAASLAVCSVIVGYRLSFLASFNKPGFREAADFLRNVDRRASVVCAGSVDQIRYYSGLELETRGGVMFIGHDPWSAIMPMTWLSNHPRYDRKAIYLQMDFREAHQPGWILQANEGTAGTLANLGFQLVHCVYKEMPFFVMPPNEARNGFLRQLGLQPYEVTRRGSNVYAAMASDYLYNRDDGRFIERLGFSRAKSIQDYLSFVFRSPSFIRQPVVLVFRREPRLRG